MPMIRYFTLSLGAITPFNVLTRYAQLEADGYEINRESLRFKTFMKKGTSCVSCGELGKYFAVEESVEMSAEPRKKVHINLYGANDRLFTVDHIIPKFWGGTDEIENLQCMCSTCNSAKGSEVPVGTKEQERALLLGALDKINKELSHANLSTKKGMTILRGSLLRQNAVMSRLVGAL